MLSRVNNINSYADPRVRLLTVGPHKPWPHAALCIASCIRGAAQTLATSNRPVVVVLALVAGAAAYFVPALISRVVPVEGPGLFFASIGATLFVPLPFGLFWPRHPWQWGICVLAGQILLQAVTEGGDMNQLPIGVVLYAALLVPAVLSGVLGAYVARMLTNRTAQSCRQ
jgi:hypothetical protein